MKDQACMESKKEAPAVERLKDWHMAMAGQQLAFIISPYKPTWKS